MYGVPAGTPHNRGAICASIVLLVHTEAFEREFADISHEEQVARLHSLLRPHLLRRMKVGVASIEGWHGVHAEQPSCGGVERRAARLPACCAA